MTLLDTIYSLFLNSSSEILDEKPSPLYIHPPELIEAPSIEVYCVPQKKRQFDPAMNFNPELAQVQKRVKCCPLQNPINYHHDSSSDMICDVLNFSKMCSSIPIPFPLNDSNIMSSNISLMDLPPHPSTQSTPQPTQLPLFLSNSLSSSSSSTCVAMSDTGSCCSASIYSDTSAFGENSPFVVPHHLEATKPTVRELWENMADLHVNYQADLSYLDHYHNIDLSYRQCVLSYMYFDICQPNKVSATSFHLAVNYFDRFMTASLCGANSVSCSKNFYKRYLLIGVTSLFVACKFEEIHPPNISFFTNCGDFFAKYSQYKSYMGKRKPTKANSADPSQSTAGDSAESNVLYTKRMVHSMEKLILVTLQWELRPFTAVSWLEVYLGDVNNINFDHNCNDKWTDLTRDDQHLFKCIPRKTSVSVDSGYNTSDGEDHQTVQSSLDGGKLRFRWEDCCGFTGDSQKCFCRELEKFYRP
eukprot:Sdes_comp18435_c0_seq1m8356